MSKCTRCLGCGKLANTDDREPWSMWLDLPLRSSLAVLSGDMVQPVDCDACGGTGEDRTDRDAASFRVRVRSDIGASGRYWWYELFDSSRPVGHQVVIGGVRATWTEAMTEGLRARALRVADPTPKITSGSSRR